MKLSSATESPTTTARCSTLQAPQCKYPQSRRTTPPSGRDTPSLSNDAMPCKRRSRWQVSRLPYISHSAEQAVRPVEPCRLSARKQRRGGTSDEFADAPVHQRSQHPSDYRCPGAAVAADPCHLMGSLRAAIQSPSWAIGVGVFMTFYEQSVWIGKLRLKTSSVLARASSATILRLDNRGQRALQKRILPAYATKARNASGRIRS